MGVDHHHLDPNLLTPPGDRKKEPRTDSEIFTDTEKKSAVCGTFTDPDQ